MSALSDLRVIDLSTGVAGPFAAKLFVGFGADVVKIETPDGDPARRIGPFPARNAADSPDPAAAPDYGGMFAYLNAGKRIATLDLKDPKDRVQAADLCAGADVVLESFPPGHAAKLGVGYADIARANPAVVVASITPFGQTGPWHDWQATDLTLAAASGLAYVNGAPDREPLKEPGDVSAFQAGACAFLGAMTALAHRDLTGHGQHVDVAALEAAASAFSPQILGAMHSGEPVARGTTPLLPCKDGYVSLNVRHDATWEYMWLFFDAPEIAADTRFSTPAARRQRAKEIERMLRPHLARHTMAELFHGLAPLRLLIGMTLGVDRLLEDPHLAERGFFVLCPALGENGVMPGAPFKMSATPFSHSDSPPTRRASAAARHSPSPSKGEGWGEGESPRRPVPSPSPLMGEGWGEGENPRLPLSHMRATVLTQAWAGAYATRLLADMGAEVIQIEALDRPDPWRGGYPPRLSGTYPGGAPGERPYDRNAAYNSVNTGKKGITLDLNHDEARNALLDLVSVSDVVAENFSPRVLGNLGIGYEALREANPSIVLLRMPAYGATGPYSAYMGNGGSIEPMSGITSLLGYAGGPPLNSGVMHTDAFAGMMAASAVMIALHHRARTGRGQVIDLSQQETSIGLIADRVMGHSVGRDSLERRGNRSDLMAPHNYYRCTGDDSWVAIAIRSDDEWRELADAMGNSELGARFRDLGARQRNVGELDRIISDWTRERDAGEVAELLQARGIPAAPVLKATEIPDNPQIRAREFIEALEHPETGLQRYAGVAWRLSRTPGRLGGPAPGIGRHSAEVLREYLAMPDVDIERMVARGITGDTPPI